LDDFGVIYLAAQGREWYSFSFEAGSHRLWIFRKSKGLCGRLNRDCKEVEVQ